MDSADNWYENGLVYAIDVETFADSDGDGVGDFAGLTDRLDYLVDLGVTCIWLLPFYPTPNRDNGYDVMDYYGIDPRLGTFDDFDEFVDAAEERGMRVIIDLVVNHTSDQHPWFQEARADPDSPYRDYYVWTDDLENVRTDVGNAFPGEERDTVWTYDEVADAYYYHRFYRFQPDLNIANPDVRAEIREIIEFWLDRGVSGFRVDAATIMIEEKAGRTLGVDDPYDILREMCSFIDRRSSDAALLAEADDDPDRLSSYFGEDGMDMLLNFLLDAHLVLALAREEAEPIPRVLDILPELPPGDQWANFLRNFDELNVGRLSKGEQQDVFEAFAPAEEMRLYGRGIRRRLAPMLDGDQDRLELAYSLLFSMPGTPLLFYGEEIGLGDDLSLPGRNAARTPMHWSDGPNGGFSTAHPVELVRPVITAGRFSFERNNVAAQRDDPDSLLNRMTDLVETRKNCPEVGRGELRILDGDDPHVLVHRYDAAEDGESGGSDADGTVIAVHNLSGEARTAALDVESSVTVLVGRADVLTDDELGYEVDLPRYGYCWLRVD